MNKLFVFLMVVAAVTAYQSCTYKDKETLYPTDLSGCDTTNITYSNYIAGLMTSTCATSGCHSGNGPAAGYDLSTYAGVKKSIDDEKLMNTINWVTKPMPQNQAKLDQCTINKVQAWVNAGAQNN